MKPLITCCLTLSVVSVCSLGQPCDPAELFNHTAEFDTVQRPQSFAIGDLDGDGDVDIAVAIQNINQAGILLNNGDGTFQPIAFYAVGDDPYSIAIGDINADGRPDLAVANSDSYDISLLLNTGSGTFFPQFRLPVARQPLSIELIDINGDKALDMVANEQAFLNPGNGLFALATPISAGRYENSRSFGDINNDGFNDFVYSSFDDVVVAQINQGDGTFQETIASVIASGGGGIALADFDHDSDLDFAITQLLNQNNSVVSVFKNDGLGNFTNQADYEVGERALSLSTADFNMDGTIDLVVANQSNSSITLLLGIGDGTFVDGVNYGIDGFPQSIEAADFTGDGLPDVATLNISSNTVSISTNRGDGVLTGNSYLLTPRESNSVAMGDLNKDGFDDLVITNTGVFSDYGKSISVRLSNGLNSYEPGVQYAAGVEPRAVVLSDIDNDDDLDVLVANQIMSNFSVYLNNGAGTLSEQILYSTSGAPNSLIAADLNNDGFSDIALTSRAADHVLIFWNNGSGEFVNETVFGELSDPRSILAVDIDIDGFLDLVVANHRDDNVVVFMNNGDSTMSAATYLDAGNGPRKLALGDLDNNGYQDIAVANDLSHNVSILMNINGVFNPPTLHPTSYKPQTLLIQDMNSDGLCDIVVLGVDIGKSQAMLNNGDGTYLHSPYFGVGPSPTGFAIRDIDQSGSQDLIVTNRSSNTISIVLNQCSFNAPCQADLNSDGSLNFLDVSVFLTAFGQQDPIADIESDGNYNFLDVSAFLSTFGAGCP